MPTKRPPLVNGEIYHVVIRGVGDFPIFKDESDYYRAIFSLFEFNTDKPVTIKGKREKRRESLTKAVREQFSDTREKLVEIFCFFFMPNHIHLLLKQIRDNGITQFMRKLGTGYATYFNKKYQRQGHLFQGRFKAVHIKDNKQLITVFIYVHSNGASLIEPGWKEKGIENPEKVIEFLENYKWSSYADYIGKKNFPSLTKRDFLLETIGGEKKHKELIENWIRYKKEIKDIDEDEVALE